MRKVSAIAFSISVLCLLLSATAWGQGRTGPQESGRWEPPGQYARMFDPKNLETFSGEVTTVDQLTPGYGMSDRVWLGLQTDKHMILVILGPTWFHNVRNFKIEPKDRLEVKGSMITGMEEPMFIATEVKNGAQVIKLRDDSGYPVWAPPRQKHEK
ncbi:MAG: DNA-binding protein [Deltaproteobacteria bacterium]|nr:MAG: DNA-binding protein [Deltaproteobacteria bacterium]